MLGCARAQGNRTTVLHQQVAAVVQLATYLGAALDKPSAFDPALLRDLGDDAAPVGGQPSISLPPIRVAASALRPLVLNRCRHVPAPLAFVELLKRMRCLVKQGHDLGRHLESEVVEPVKNPRANAGGRETPDHAALLVEAA